jgi:glutamate N-acetyltransferase/amino-acid N-acetyltransferase
MAVTQPRGFLAGGACAGIKPSGRPDLCLIVREPGGEGAGAGAGGGVAGFAATFTTNAVLGAPVLIGLEQRARVLGADRGAVPRAVLVNSGNSNAATGEQGVRDARACMAGVGGLLGCEGELVVPSSTGVIGRPLPVGKIVAALPGLVASLGRGEAADAAAARAIMTTDLVPKAAFASVEVGGREVRIGAIAKGSGMIAPRLDQGLSGAAAGGSGRLAPPSATMLAFVTTDAPIGSRALQGVLDRAGHVSFNRVSVDNHASCSDTLIALSSGAAGGAEIVEGTRELEAFERAFTGVCERLAEMIVTDGEGATRVFRASVVGAGSDSDAERMARQIVDSPLVKCAIHGRDPNWGRIVTAAGNAGVRFDPLGSSLTIGPVEVYRAGVPVVAALSDPRLGEAMSGARVELVLTVGTGPGRAWMMGCDLSKEYVSINADYTT